MTQYVTLPGIGGSGQTHWHTLWEAENREMRRFSPPSWDEPQLGDWCDALDRAVATASEQPILIAHSLACLLVAHWSGRSSLSVRGAFLVSVPDPASARFPKSEAASFVDVPDWKLRFPSIVVSSSNDPYGTSDYQRNRAAAWGSTFVDLGEFGHINGSSGLGAWLVGRELLDTFARRTGNEPFAER